VKKFSASDLSKKPSELFKAAREEGAIIQHKTTRGAVLGEYVLLSKIKCDCLVAASRGTLGVGDYYD